MHRALLIDRNYMALSIIPWKKAVRLLVKGKAEAVETETDNSTSIKTGSGAFNIPSIIRLLVNIPWRAHKSRMKFSRRNVMIRDNYMCQYCGIKLGKQGGTIDHVVPRARGGQTTYTNCVASCKSCNNKKADKPLEQSGFKLTEKPKRPGFITLYKQHLKEYSPEEWENYIIGVT
jgi:5-methylcytosine-specific restriction endonuclease McrA